MGKKTCIILFFLVVVLGGLHWFSRYYIISEYEYVPHISIATDDKLEKFIIAEFAPCYGALTHSVFFDADYRSHGKIILNTYAVDFNPFSKHIYNAPQIVLWKQPGEREVYFGKKYMGRLVISEDYENIQWHPVIPSLRNRTTFIPED